MEAVRGIRYWLLAWLAAAALWMVLADSVRPAEVLAGAFVATLAATGFEVVRRERVAAQSFMPGLSVRVWRVLLKIVPDVARLTRAAFIQLFEREPVRGRVLAMRFGHGDDHPDDRAYRAVATGLGSIAPNSIVIGADPEGVIYVHQLEPTRKPSDLDPLRLR